jgi:hypothetical protein
MSRVCLAVVLIALIALKSIDLAASSPERSCAVGDNIRPMRAWIGQVLREFVPQSPTLARLVDALRSAPVVIHLDDDLGANEPWDGRIRFVTTAGRCRYLRIDLRPQAMPAHAAAVLAHELQHAVEVDRGEVADRAAFGRLFRRIGFDVPRDERTTFDTEAAVEAGRRALEEITGRPARPAVRTSLTRRAVRSPP